METHAKGKKISSNPTIGIVNLSAPEPVWFDEFYSRGLAELRKRGVSIVEGSIIKDSYYYLASKPERIAEDLHAMFQNSRVDVIMCAGGGMNMNKVLPHIDFALLRQNAKPFVGISNITVLMCAMLSQEMVSFHGPLSLWNYGLDGTPTEFTHKNLMDALSGYVGKLQPLTEWKIFRHGSAEGELLGGNISSLGTVVGTKYCPAELFDDKLFLLEDLGEDLSRLDSIITHMELLGVFDRITGLVIGKLKDCRPPENVSMTLMEFIDLIVGKYQFPVIYDCDFGHIADNLCLPIGCRAKLIAEESPELIVLESGVI